MLQGKRNVGAHVIPYVVGAFLLVFNGDQVTKILPVQFRFDFRDFGNPASQQHILAMANGLDVLEMDQVQTRRQLADRVHRIVSAGCEVAGIGRGAAVGGKAVERFEYIFRALVRKLHALEEVVVNGEGQACIA